MTPSARVLASLVTVERATRTVHEFGVAETWSEVATVPARVRLPTGLSLVRLGRQPAERRLSSVYFAPTVSVAVGDRIRWDGQYWRVSGVARQPNGAFVRADVEEIA